MKKVFIDGSSGTTGLRIRERLMDRKDISLISIPEEMRKDVNARKDALNSADVVFLCLPDDAAAESAGLMENNETVVIDTSTAHRTDDAWVYGFPEIEGRRELIKTAKRIANPGCHASGFIALAAPLVKAGVLCAESGLSCFSLTGYSGGGKKMISEYGPSGKKDDLLEAPRMYGLSQQHKHIPEMIKVCGLKKAPLFCPVVADYYCGMEVVIPLFADDINADIKEIRAIYDDYYKQGMVKYKSCSDEQGFLSAAAFSGRDDMQVSVFGNSERILLVSRFDNLGKGASGAALQNMNIALGLKEDTGLIS